MKGLMDRPKEKDEGKRSTKTRKREREGKGRPLYINEEDTYPGELPRLLSSKVLLTGPRETMNNDRGLTSGLHRSGDLVVRWHHGGGDGVGERLEHPRPDESRAVCLESLVPRRLDLLPFTACWEGP